ncbi:MAG: hypothetical protein JW902_16335 [Syntrophaceae bacterium]|nr:hypothetical protein [Syntrophaceae bacterium]
MPIICIKSEDSGITYVPLFKKNAQGDWELAEPEFRKMLEPHTVYEKPATKEEE